MDRRPRRRPDRRGRGARRPPAAPGLPLARGPPPDAAGHWIPDLVTAAGGDPVAARAGRSEQISWPEIAAARPDLVIVAPCGYHLAGAVSQAAAVTAALPGIPVWAIDADSLVVRPGPRLVDGVEAIAAILHPGAVPAPPGGRIALA